MSILTFKEPLHLIPINYVNKLFAGKEPWKIVVTSSLVTLFVLKIHNFVTEEDFSKNLKKTVFNVMRLVPSIKKKIEEGRRDASKSIAEEMRKPVKDLVFIKELPKEGWSEEDILATAKQTKTLSHCDWKNGMTSGGVYHARDDLYQLMLEVYGHTVSSNLLHPELFPGERKMECEVIRMVASMFHGDEDSCGVMTSGGTESLILACLAYRNYGKTYKGIKKAEIILPVTAHAAFDKAAEFLNITLRHIPLDPNTLEVDVKAMKRAINKNTVLLVGSAPDFPHGIVDPIEEISKLGLYYNIPVHVDACLGGFLYAFAHDAGFTDLPLFDFKLPGVTSISCDTHKYGFAMKGTSTLIYRNSKFRDEQFFCQPNWPGGVYASPTIGGSRPGGVVCATWAVMMRLGYDGYVESTRRIITTTRYMTQQLSHIPGVKVLGSPKLNVLAWDTPNFDIYTMASKMTDRGWSLNALQFPPGLHIAVTLLHTESGVADKFCTDIREISDELAKLGPVKPTGAAAIYGVSQQIPDRRIVSDLAKVYLNEFYNTD